MTSQAPPVPPQLMDRVQDTLGRLCVLDGIPEDEVRFRSWVPNSARKQRRRLFVSGGARDRPVYVAKIPLDPLDTMVVKERGILRAPAPAGVARPGVACEFDRGFVMDWVPDRDFPHAFGEGGTDRARVLLEQAVDLMLPLHTGDPAAGPGDATPIARAYLGDLLEQAGPAALDALSHTWIGPSHGDLGPWNIRWDASDGRLALIDWEDYHDSGITTIDLLNTVLTSALVVFPDYQQRGFGWLGEQMFGLDGPFRTAMRAALRRYAGATGQSAAALARLVPVCCLWLHRRIEKQGRPADHLFYRPLTEYFLRAEPDWIGALDD
ncbi:phosphotransferase family protein [Streptantibioticus silvisoli]|uniref:Phosphotransferase n=1 Tax=Streptantibioticus silvisoli TaxID=2705255 RepID=A0ABT6VSD5_9ACTN|nr:phosphotransferase [Streptantibioticus silvisoli]MDI5961385.1 phosphotransferase [Streptantibioticus silvisoli]